MPDRGLCHREAVVAVSRMSNSRESILHGQRKEACMSLVRCSVAFRGNKSHLPSKPCTVCGLAMTWRRRWAKSWAEVKYCSEACRRKKTARG